MVTIHSIEEMLNFYISLGGLRKDAANGFRYVFPRQHSKVRFWGDLHGFSAADADFTYPKDTIIRSQFSQRYVGIGLSEQGPWKPTHREIRRFTSAKASTASYLIRRCRSL